MDPEHTCTMAQFIREHRITMSAEWVDRNPNMADDEWARSASHYRCTLRGTFEGKRRAMQTYYSMGAAHTEEPKAEEVLDCLASDASGVENSGTFEQWAGEYGYDPDSRKAEQTYRACDRAAKRLARFLDTPHYDQLLWRVERL